MAGSSSTVSMTLPPSRLEEEENITPHIRAVEEA
jgi:hypothetical protein